MVNLNMLTKISNEWEYKAAMETIKSLLNKATEAGGFHNLTDEEATMLDSPSKLAEAYEDNIKIVLPLIQGSVVLASQNKIL